MRKGQVAQCPQGMQWLIEGPTKKGLVPVSSVTNPLSTFWAPVADLTILPGVTRKGTKVDALPKASPQEALYACSQSGRVVCGSHLGGYGTAALKASPRASQWVTPLNVWARVTDAERALWLKDLGSPMACEDCPQPA